MNKSTIAWTLAILGAIGDTVTTMYALSTGAFYEGNPFMSFMIESVGWSAIATGHVLVLVIAYVLSRRIEDKSWLVPAGIAVVWMPVTIWNIALLTGII